MPSCKLKSSVEKNTADIQVLTKSLVELSANVHMLAEGQKNLGDLVRSQVEHNIEIQTLKQRVGELTGQLHKYRHRIETLEDYRLTTQAANTARSGLMSKIINYTPIAITALLALITVGVVLTVKELSL